MKLNKIDGKENSSDLGTKHLDQATMLKYLARVNVKLVRAGCGRKTSKVAGRLLKS